MNAGDLLATLRSALGATGRPAELDGVCAGDAGREVNSLAVSFAPSVEVLRRAAAVGCQTVLADAHPFYHYDPYWSRLPGVFATVEASAGAAAKRALIAELGLVVLRIRTDWTAARPVADAEALARSLGLHPEGGSSRPFCVCEAPDRLTGELAARTARTLRTSGLRVVGDLRARVRRVAVAAGLITTDLLAEMLRRPNVDAVIGGEVVEWHAGPYMQDVVASGRRAALILTGFAASLEPGAAALQAFAQGAAPQVQVVYLPGREPVWAPGRAA